MLMRFVRASDLGLLYEVEYLKICFEACLRNQVYYIFNLKKIMQKQIRTKDVKHVRLFKLLYTSKFGTFD